MVQSGILSEAVHHLGLGLVFEDASRYLDLGQCDRLSVDRKRTTLSNVAQDVGIVNVHVKVLSHEEHAPGGIFGTNSVAKLVGHMHDGETTLIEKSDEGGDGSAQSALYNSEGTEP